MKELIADEHNFKKDQVLIGNGAVEILYQLTRAIRPDKVLIIDPTFSEYELASKAARADIFNFKLDALDNFELTDKKIEQLIKRISDIDLLFLCNPNNPTGKIISKRKIDKILNIAKEEKTFVLIDEAFIDFYKNYKDLSAIEFIASYDNILILRSLTKIYGIPGLRLGYALTSKKIINNIEKSRDPWTVNCFAQLACKKIFTEFEKQQNFISRTFKMLNKEKEYLYINLNKLKGFKVYYPVANFIFIDLKDSHLNSTELTDNLAKEGVMIRNCNNYNGLDDNYIRVAVKSRSDNNILLNKLSQLV